MFFDHWAQGRFGSQGWSCCGRGLRVSGLPKCPPTVPEAECAKLKHDFAADGIAVTDTVVLKPLTVLKARSDPEQFDLRADEQRFFVSNEETGTVTVLELRSATGQARIPVGHEPEGIRISPGRRLGCRDRRNRQYTGPVRWVLTIHSRVFICGAAGPTRGDRRGTSAPRFIMRVVRERMVNKMLHL